MRSRIYLSILIAFAFSFTVPNHASAQCTENFDGVAAPALPVGWTATVGATCATTARWATVNTLFNSAPNSVFANDPACVSDELLDSKTFNIISAAAQLTFRRNNNLESGFDGMVLEIKIGAGAFTDILAAGGSFVTGGYNGTISVNFSSPIGGRQAWTGNSGGWVTTTVNLPAAANGQVVILRFRRASDSSVSATGVNVDDISITGCGIPPAPCAENFDAVVAPALPNGITRATGATCGTSAPWATTNALANSAPNSAFTNDPNCISDEYLLQALRVTSATSVLTFQRNNDLESGFDGMVLEISINGGAFQDIITAGGAITTGGYNGTISLNFNSPIAGRNAWTGNSAGWVLTTVSLPAAANNQNVVLRWRRASDQSVSGVGVNIDDIAITGSDCACRVNCPANVIVSNNANQCGAVVTFPASTSTGTCGAIVTSPASGSFFPVGTTIVTSTSGAASCTFTVRVNDTQAPTITCPANMTVSNTAGLCGANVTFPAPTIADNCPGATFTYSPASGSFFPKGTTTVTATARDAANNTATCTFTVTVNDTQAPTITCPANITVGNATGQCGANVNFVVNASDNCPFPGSVPLTVTQSSSQSLVVGSVACNAGGLHTDNSYWRAIDLTPLALSGPFQINQVSFGVEQAIGATGSQPVTVRIHTSAGPFPASARTLIGSQTFTVPNMNGAIFTGTFSTAPTVPANAILVIEIFTPNGQAVGNSFFIGSNAATESGFSYISAADCGAPNPVTLGSLGFPNMHVVMNAIGIVSNPQTSIVTTPASGSFFPVGVTTVNSTVTDASGNTASCSFTVRVNDTQAPSITCPGNITATTPLGSCTAVVPYTVTSSDNCPGVTQALQSGLASNAVYPLGVTTNTWRATDAAGNISTCTFTVTVRDGQLPVIGAQPVNITSCVGSNTAFSVTSTNALSYQWQQWNGTAWVNIAGATASTLPLNALTLAMNTNTYRVNVIGLCTTVTSTAASLYVNALPTITLTTTKATLTPGETTSITAVVKPTGGSITWTHNGSPIPGGFTISGLGIDDIGTYKATYTDLNGCKMTSNDLVINALSTNNLYVMPNPNNGQFQVRFYATSTGTPLTVTVYASSGAKVYQQKLTSGQPYSAVDVDLGQAAGGVYMVEIHDTDGKKIAARKIVVRAR